MPWSFAERLLLIWSVKQEVVISLLNFCLKTCWKYVLLHLIFAKYKPKMQNLMDSALHENSPTSCWLHPLLDLWWHSLYLQFTPTTNSPIWKFCLFVVTSWYLPGYFGYIVDDSELILVQSGRSGDQTQIFKLLKKMTNPWIPKNWGPIVVMSL